MPDTIYSLDSLLKISEIISILAGGGLVAFKLGRTTTRVEATLEMQNSILRKQSDEITELKLETKKLGDVLTQIAVQSVRIGHIEDDLRDLRHKKERAISAA
jgi:hypothetical protein